MQGILAYSRYEQQPGNNIFVFPFLQVFVIPVFNSETLSVTLNRTFPVYLPESCRGNEHKVQKDMCKMDYPASGMILLVSRNSQQKSEHSTTQATPEVLTNSF